MPSLGDQVVALFKTGKLPNPMRTADIQRRFRGEYADSYISVVLSNFEEKTGDYVTKRGRKALFRRVAEGRYVAL
jgi:hypothetical protein